MKVFVKIHNGSSFEIELDHLDTVFEVKQKIENSQRIAVSKQTLFFDGMVLQDDLDLEQSHIVNDSRLQLVVSPDHNPNPPSNTTEQIIKGHQDSTVTSQVLQTELSPSSNSVKYSSVELTRKKRMVVHVWVYSGEIRAPAGNQVAVDVKTKDNVKELRNELVKIQERGELNLPQEGYLLTHKNKLLNENMSFWDAGVDHNDTIEILPLRLTSYTMDSKFLVPYL